MPKTILVTGSTDGIGLETAKLLAAAGHNVLLHGRNPHKLTEAAGILSAMRNGGSVETYTADFSRMADVEALANEVIRRHPRLDVLINNAGVYRAAEPMTEDGLDIRFAVNTIAPYLLTQRLLPLMQSSGRVINLSSAAQAPVDPRALAGKTVVSDGAAYAQSKLALTMWSRSLGLHLKGKGPLVVSVNPGSLLGSKMVKEAFGVAGGDLAIGADILRRAALEEEFAAAHGLYFDNDSGRFADPHRDALDPRKSREILSLVETIISRTTQEQE